LGLDPRLPEPLHPEGSRASSRRRPASATSTASQARAAGEAAC